MVSDLRSIIRVAPGPTGAAECHRAGRPHAAVELREHLSNNDGVQNLRNAHKLIRLVLMMFVCCLGVAVASPLIAPQTYELICSGTGMVKMLVKGDDGKPADVSASTFDCPLCATGAAPPSFPSVSHDEPMPPLAYATWPVPAARIAALTAAPLPARGPPLQS